MNYSFKCIESLLSHTLPILKRKTSDLQDHDMSQRDFLFLATFVGIVGSARKIKIWVQYKCNDLMNQNCEKMGRGKKHFHAADEKLC